MVQTALHKKQTSLTNEFISFRIGKESFAVEAVSVREVLKNKSVTEVPGMRDYLPGVINLRGNIISVIDLGVILGVKHQQDHEHAWFVIAETQADSERLQVGVLVDAVEDVVRLEKNQIDPAPDIGMEFDSAFVRGIGKQEGRYTVILDIDRILSFVISETDRLLSEQKASGVLQNI